MRTDRSLTVCRSLLFGGRGAGIWSPSISPWVWGLHLIPLNFPLGCGPGPDPPSISSLGVGLEGGVPSSLGGASFLEGVSPWWWVSSPGSASFWGKGASLAGGLLLGWGVPPSRGSPWQGSLPGRAVSLAGGSPSQGGASFWEGLLLGWGVSFLGVSFWGGLLLGGCLLPRGFSFLGVPPSLGCLLPGGGSIPACTEADPPMDRITDTSKIINLATTSLRPIITTIPQSWFKPQNHAMIFKL